jgi:Lon protease-like protein
LKNHHSYGSITSVNPKRNLFKMPLEHLEDLQPSVPPPGDELSRRRLIREMQRQSRAVAEVLNPELKLYRSEAKDKATSLAEVIPIKTKDETLALDALDTFRHRLEQ